MKRNLSVIALISAVLPMLLLWAIGAGGCGSRAVAAHGPGNAAPPNGTSSVARATTGPVAVGVALDPTSPRAAMLKDLPLDATPCPDLLAALATNRFGIVIADASPAALAALFSHQQVLNAFTARGGWLILWGITPEGLADFDRLVGVSHLMRPFTVEDLHLPSPPDPLLQVLNPDDVVMMSDQRGRFGDLLREANAWSYVLDGTDIAPFSSIPPPSYWGTKGPAGPGYDRYPPNMVNGFYESWKDSFNFSSDRPANLSWTMAFPRPEVLTGFSIAPETNYKRIRKLRLSFTGSTAAPVEIDLQPSGVDGLRQDFPLPDIPASGINLKVIQLSEYGIGLTGIGNLWFTVKRDSDFHTRVRQLLSLGVLDAYPRGAGGIIANQMRVDGKLSRQNRAKQTRILSALLRNLGALPQVLRLPSIISDGMVLQRDTKCPIWGWAPDGTAITVRCDGQQATTVARDGQFRVDFPTGKAGGPYEMAIDAGAVGKVVIEEVYVGEVWLFSGQSNMDFEVQRTPQGKTVATQPARLIHLSSAHGWVDADPKSIPPFSAVAFYMGKALANDLHVPIGLIQRDVPGSAIQWWISPKALRASGLWNVWNNVGSDFYSQCIVPCQPYAIRGVVWYQGEQNANSDESDVYRTVLGCLIQSWRADWGQGDLPFIVVQLPAIVKGYGSAPIGWAAVREAQQRTADDLPNTGLVVTYDVSDGDLHPVNKRPMGQRAALVARTLAYHEDIESSGPVVHDYLCQGDKVIIHFTHTGKALETGSYDLKTDSIEPSPSNQLTDFRAVDAAGKSVHVDAVVDGQSVVVDLKDHRDAAMLTYGWAQFPKGNLYNEAKLPSSPFRLRPHAISVVNGGFESPVLAAGKTGRDASWEFAGGDGGIGANGSWCTPFLAPEGLQQAFLAVNATMSQTLHGLTAGRAYQVTLYLARAGSDDDVVEVLIDHTSLRKITPVSGHFNLERCHFTATAADQDLRIVNLGPGNRAAFIDDVQVHEASFIPNDGK